RLDDVDGVDADAGPIVARRGRDVPRHVDSDDGSNDAAVARPDAVALSSDVRCDKRPATRSADHAGWSRILLRMDADRSRRLPARFRGGCHSDATAGDGTCGATRSG